MSGQKRWGATIGEWDTFSLTLKLTGDLLPVVSNLEAPISPASSLKKVGKVPSRYNKARQVTGIGDWTNHVSTQEDVDRWADDPDIGLSVICRVGKPADVDVPDPVKAMRVQGFIARYLEHIEVGPAPIRHRKDSGKHLMLMLVNAETPKTVIKVDGGIVEFLGNRQQFIASGTHEDGSRYEWSGLDQGPPVLTLEQYNDLIGHVQRKFGVEDEARTEKAKKAPEMDTEDILLQKLQESNMVLSTEQNGSLGIVCPFDDEHTTESANSATVYYPAHTGGFAHSSIKCLHAHCVHRQTHDFAAKLGISAVDDFDVLTDEDCIIPVETMLSNEGRFAGAMAGFGENARKKVSGFHLIKGLIPSQSVGLLLGAGSAGKTFAILSMMAAVARGVAWNGLKTHRVKVVYVCAEGSLGFKYRSLAYLKEHNLENLDIKVFNSSLDFSKRQDVLDFVAYVKTTCPDVGWVVIDTMSMTMSGDENSAVDIEKYLSGCRYVQRAFKAAVTILHHLGKDAGKGARGHSSLRSNTTYQIVVSKDDKASPPVHEIYVERQKDLNFGQRYYFKLKVLEVAKDDDGEDITSCVIEMLDDADFAAVDEEPVRIGKLNQDILDSAKEFYIGNNRWPIMSEVVTLVREGNTRRKNDVVSVLERMVEKGELDERNSYILVPGRLPTTEDLSS